LIKGFDIVPLIGNHESMLLESLENEDYLSKWIQNGGNKTMQSCGIQSLNELNSAYISFFKGLKYYYPFELSFGACWF
jgi:serine/threonine protein phosphatase 1